jgi:hypothetical protein
MKAFQKLFALAALVALVALAFAAAPLFVEAQVVGPGAARLQQTSGYPWQLAGDFPFTSTSTATAGFDVRGISYYRILWIPQSFSGTCSISLDGATGVVAGTGALASPVIGGILSAATIGSCATAGEYVTTSIAGVAAYGQITPTIVGTGTVIVIIFGYTDNPAAGGSSSSIISSPLDGSGNVKTNCEVGCAAGTPGQAAMAASQPVVIASNQSAVQIAGAATPADAASTPTTAMLAQAWPMGWNGTTSDRLRTAGVGNTVPATGLLASAHYCEYLSSLPTLTTGTYGAAQCDSSGRLLVNLATALPAGSSVIGGVTTQPTGFSAAINFQQSVTASAVALATNSSHSFCVQAFAGNTITVYVGASGVTTTTGFPLAAGQPACLQLSNTNLIYVIASTTGASVAVIGN